MKIPFYRSWIVSLLQLLAGVPLVGAGEQWLTRNWQSDAGLPDNSVVGIEQTPDGFLWVATKTGLQDTVELVNSETYRFHK